jgi:hypothetical protein
VDLVLTLWVLMELVVVGLTRRSDLILVDLVNGLDRVMMMKLVMEKLAMLELARIGLARSLDLVLAGLVRSLDVFLVELVLVDPVRVPSSSAGPGAEALVSGSMGDNDFDLETVIEDLDPARE